MKSNIFKSVSLTFLVAVIFSSPMSAQSQQSSNTGNNILQYLNLDVLYYQDNFLKLSDFRRICTPLNDDEKTPEFYSDCRIDQQDFLEDRYLSIYKDMIERQIYRKFNAGLLAGAAQFIPLVLAQYINFGPHIQAWLHNSPFGLVLSNMFLNSMSDVSTAGDGVYDPFRKLEIDYVRVKPWLGPELQKAIENNFGVARRSENSGRYESFARWAVSFPLDSEPSKKVDLEALQEKLGEQIDPNTFIQIKTFMGALKRREKPYYMSEMEPGKTLSDTVNRNRRQNAYFWGKTRTGKSNAAAEIAKALGLPMRKIEVAGLDIETLLGTSIESSNPKPGKLLEMMLEPKKRNMIIVFDEIDRLINMGQTDTNASQPNTKGDSTLLLSFLDLLDPKTTHFWSPYLGIYVDISHITFIMTGNNEIRDAALLARLNVVHFQGYTKAYMKKVMHRDWAKEIIEEESLKPGCKLTQAIFSKPEVQRDLNQLFEVENPHFGIRDTSYQGFINKLVAQECPGDF